jgi:serine/threonine-protein kinase HipA
MGVEGKFSEIALSDMQAVAERHSVPAWREIVARVRDARARWPEYAEQAGVPEQRARSIASDMEKLQPR